jgi:hypothetical protein
MQGSLTWTAIVELASKGALDAALALAFAAAAFGGARLFIRIVAVLVLARGRGLSGAQYLELIALVLDRRSGDGAGKVGSANESA